MYVYICMCLVAPSCLTVCDPMDYSLPGSSVHGDSPVKNTGVGCHVLLQGIFPTQGSNPGFPQCRQILYCLSHQESPRMLEWVAYPFSSGSSQPRNWTEISCIAGSFFTNWAISKAQIRGCIYSNVYSSVSIFCSPQASSSRALLPHRLFILVFPQPLA